MDRRPPMDSVDLWNHTHRLLPESVHAKIYYVHHRVHWNQIEVCFHKPGQQKGHVVRIPKEDWLNDAAIARLCLECP